MEQFESEERFRAVVDAAPEIICTVTPDGRFTWFGVFPDRQPSEAVVRLVRIARSASNDPFGRRSSESMTRRDGR